jgi:hypothetical protein
MAPLHRHHVLSLTALFFDPVEGRHVILDLAHDTAVTPAARNFRAIVGDNARRTENMLSHHELK